MASTTESNGKGLVVAIIGASGAIGREIATLLDQRSTLEVRRVDAYATRRSAGDTLDWGDGVPVREWHGRFVEAPDLVFVATPFEAGASIWSRWPETDARVVDLSGHRGPAGDAPLVVPGVGGDEWKDQHVVASPSGPVGPVALVTEALFDVDVPVEVSATLFMPASSRGQQGMEALAGQTTALLNQKDVPVDLFPQRLAFNLIPDVDGIPGFGEASRAERLFEAELPRVLGEPDLDVVCSAVRVPIFSGQAAQVVWRFEGPVDTGAILEALRGCDGVELVDDPREQRYPLAGNISEVDEVQVGRMRVVGQERNRLSAWVVSDNLRKGGALNAVQIAERWFGRRRPPV